MTREEAEQSIQAHAITRWLGRDSTDWAPGVVELTPGRTFIELPRVDHTIPLPAA